MRILRKAENPGAPYEPNRSRGVLMATMIGFVFSVWLALMIEEINQKIRTEKDINRISNLPFLGYVPLTKELIKPKQKHSSATAVDQLPHLIYYAADR